MTYDDLVKLISGLTPDQKQADVAVYIDEDLSDDAVYGKGCISLNVVTDCCKNEEVQCLDENHPYIYVHNIKSEED